MKLYTIGYSDKSAEEFFRLIQENNIECLVDIRIYPNHNGAKYATKRDLPYLLKELASCDYEYLADLAPTPKLLDDFHKDGDWEKYVRGFTKLLDERNIPHSLDKILFEEQTCCLMCFEATPEQCHRRLTVERMQKYWRDVEIVHL